MGTELLFHIVIIEKLFGNDRLISLLAKDQEFALEKLSRSPKFKKYIEGTARVYTDEEYKELNNKAWVIFYQGQRSELHCRILAPNKNTAKNKFGLRFPSREITRIEKEKREENTSTGNQRIKFAGITAVPVMA